MKRYIASFAALITLSLNAQNIVSDKAVIFLKEKVMHASNDSPTSRFTPTADEAVMADEIVKEYIKQKYPQETTVVVDNYFKQYYGSILMSQHIIYMKGCCKKPEKFTEEMYEEKGGGSCYFDARINLKSKKIMSFKFNTK